jgi:hypothetical protein
VGLAERVAPKSKEPILATVNQRKKATAAPCETKVRTWPCSSSADADVTVLPVDPISFASGAAVKIRSRNAVGCERVAQRLPSMMPPKPTEFSSPVQAGRLASTRTCLRLGGSPGSSMHSLK